MCRNEWRHQTLAKLLGSKTTACSLFAATVFMLGLVRDFLFAIALDDQPRPLDSALLGLAVFLAGGILVLSSMIRLGVHGTYMGDYFGIHFTTRLEGFPFVLHDPMYVGSALMFAGTALLHGSVAGLGLGLWVHICYRIASVYEAPFTQMIYSKVQS